MTQAYALTGENPHGISAFGDTFVQALNALIQFIDDNNLSELHPLALNSGIDNETGEVWVTTFLSA